MSQAPMMIGLISYVSWPTWGDLLAGLLFSLGCALMAWALSGDQ